MEERTLKPSSKEYRKLVVFADMLTALSASNTIYHVEDTYLDYGQGWKWTTIIANRPDGSSWQALSPREWSEVVSSASVVELAEIAEEHFEDRYCCDKRVTF